MKSTGERIAAILKNMEGPDRGKQSRLADIAGCSRGLINQLLTNPGQELGYEYAKNIEDALGYRVDWILNGKGPQKLSEVRAAALEDEVSADEIIELAILFRQSTATSRQRILKYARQAEKLPGALRKILPASNDS